MGKPFPHVLGTSSRNGVDADESELGDTQRYRYRADSGVCKRWTAACGYPTACPTAYPLRTPGAAAFTETDGYGQFSWLENGAN
jgi:hypothetical protein